MRSVAPHHREVGDALKVKAPQRPQALARQIFRGSLALKEGLLSARQLESNLWLHLGYDLYSDSRLERDHELRCRAILTVVRQHVYFAGPSAAFLYGLDHAATYSDPVHLLIPAGSRLNARQPTIVHRMVIANDEHTVIRGFPITTPLRTCWDIALWLEPVKAVALIDGLLAAELVTPGELTDLIAKRLGYHGARRALKTFGYADGGAQSPAESALRVRLILRGFPRPCTQFPIRVNGVVLHPDLAWPEYMVAMEYDGLWHNQVDKFHLDRQRLNLLSTAGWLVVHVTSRRMHTDFAGVVTDLVNALQQRGWNGRLRPER